MTGANLNPRYTLNVPAMKNRPDVRQSGFAVFYAFLVFSL